MIRSHAHLVRHLAGLLALALLGACATTRFENSPLAPASSNTELRVVDLSDRERPLILLAVSGGGSRAADLGWVVLTDLAGFEYGSAGARRKLTEDIGVVSSVSGGSVIAAHFALYRTQGLPGFEPDFLLPDNMRTLERDAANPFTWTNLAIKGAARVDVVKALFDKQLFHGATFLSLNQPGHPYLIMNATDMASGEVFAFTPTRFDDICADFDQEAISVGVASSSAVPVALSPVALDNYSRTHCADTPLPEWVASKLSKQNSRYLNIEQYKRARYSQELRKGETADHLYLVDGGVADNLGIHGLLEAISSPYAQALVVDPTDPTGRATILSAINKGKVSKIVVLVVNSRGESVEKRRKIYQSGSRPGVLEMIDAAVSIPIDSNTSGLNVQIDLLLDELKAGTTAPSGAPLFKDLKIYSILVDFDQFHEDQAALRDRAKRIPTSWTVSKSDHAVLHEAGVTLLHQQPCFQRLLMDLGIAADFVDRANALAACRQSSDMP